MAQRTSGPAAAGGVLAIVDRRPPRAGLVLATPVLGAIVAALVGVFLVLWKYPRHRAEHDELSAMARQNREYLEKLEAEPAADGPPS